MNKKNIEDVYKLTPVQEGILFHSLSAPESGMYFEQFSRKLPMPGLDRNIVAKSLEQLAARHPILRSSFHWEEAQHSLQVVHKKAEISVEYFDCRNLAETEHQQQIHHYMDQDRKKGFHLGKAPLMRMSFVRLTQDDYQLIWSYHHLLLDGWSFYLVLDEFLHCYQAIEQNRSADLPQLRPYRDYVAWLRRQDMAQCEKYWRNKMANFTETTPIGIDRAPGAPAGHTENYRQERFRLSQQLSTSIKKFAREKRLTLGTMLQGVWAILLGHYSGKEDIVFGVVVSGRPADLPGVENMVGLFVNTLPLRVLLNGQKPVVAWLEQFQNQLVELRNYEYSPLPQVLKWSDLSAGTALFDTIIAVETYPTGAFGEEYGKLSEVEVFQKTNYPMTVVLEPGEQIFLRLSYDTERYHQKDVKRMAGHYQNLLADIVDNGNKNLCETKVLTTEEEKHFLVECNRDKNYLRSQNIHQWFWETSRQNSEKIAASHGEQQLTYREMNTYANQLAHKLIEMGVKAGDFVALSMEPSLELLVAMVGILKAGAAYVPVDPMYPEDRIVFILEDCAPPVLVTQEHLIDKLPKSEKRKVLYLNKNFDQIKQNSAEEIECKINLHFPAYIIYTSGSTGKPKGVIVSHANVVRLFDATEEYYHFSCEDVWSFFHSSSFDFSVWEIWGALLYGGRVVVVPHKIRRAPELFYSLLVSEKVTILNQTPSAFGQLIVAEERLAEGDLSLRLVIFGGEKLELRSLLPWFERHGDQKPQLVNMYGITETTVHVTYRPISKEDVVKATGSLIGEAIADLQLYVLDQYLRPTPLGVPGEVYVGGAGVAHGYLHRPGLCAWRFIPDPFSKNPGQRLYRTGDVARYSPEGELEFVGRADFQVKIRGFRIELGEIEAVLAQHPKVRENIVLAREDIPGSKQLVGYIVAAPDIEIAKVKEFAAEHLPEYMVPGILIRFDQLPLTAHGKIDRKALPKPGENRDQAKYIEAGSETETILVEVWQEVLKKEQIGINDNFFELGGDSILSIKIISKARKRGIYINTGDLFNYQTIAELAGVCRSGEETKIEEKFEGPVPLSPVQNWFFRQELSQPDHWNQAWLFEVSKELDFDILEKAWQSLLLHHPMLRSRFIRKEQKWHQEIVEKIPENKLQIFDLRGMNQEKYLAQIKEQTEKLQASLSLAQADLSRIAHFQTDELCDRLFIAIHHLAVDGVSWRILLEDLVLAYQQLAAGGNVELPHSDFYGKWSRKWQKIEEETWAKQHIDYWQAIADQKQELLFLDVCGENNEASLDSVLSILPQEQTGSILEKSGEKFRARADELLIAAFVKALTNWHEQNGNWSIDVESHGRGLPPGFDLNRTVGWFTAIFPVIFSGRLDDSLEKYVKNSKDALRDATVHGPLFQAMKQHLSYSENLRSLHSQISFNYLGKFEVEPGTFLENYAEEKIGSTKDARSIRPYVLEINALVVRDSLITIFSYSDNLHDRKSIEKLAELYQKTLIELVDLADNPQLDVLTPSDFPLASIDDRQLSALAEKYPGLEDLYPMTPMQQGMLFHTMLNPDSGMYFEHIRFKSSGVNVEIFQKAWQKLVDSHPVLRTSLHWQNVERPLQVVQKNVPLVLVEKDWRSLTESEEKKTLEQLCREEEKQGFNLEQAPLMRIIVAQTDAQSFRVIWNFHHILIDGWSLSLLLQELFAYYQNIEKNIEKPLPSRPLYKNYVSWIERSDREAANYWQNYLEGVEGVTALTIEKPGKSEMVYRRQKFDFELEHLETAAKECKVTINTLFQGAWAIVVNRYSRRNDILFGITVSGRSSQVAGIEEMIGLFINTLPLRVKMDERHKVSDFLRNLQANAIGHRDYEHVPLMAIKKTSNLGAGVELFDNILVFENYPVEETLRSHMSETVTDVEFEETSNYPLALSIMPGNGIELTVHYHENIYDGEQIAQLVGHFKQALIEICGKLQRTIAEIDILSPEERKKITVDFNRTGSDYPSGKTMHALFEQNVNENPENTALVYRDQKWNYDKLNRHANKLAHYLISQGIGPEMRVGICIKRSPEMVVALLSVLKAGAGYVPLDPNYPVERIAYMVEDSKASFILAQDQTLESLPQDMPGCFCLDSDWHKLDSMPDSNPHRKIDSFNLSYIIYTSGSTGRPKGSLLVHECMVNFYEAVRQAFKLDNCARVLQFASFSFDASVMEFIMGLCSGGVLVIIDSENLLPTPEFVEFLDKEQISHLFLTPPSLAVMPHSPLPKLRHLFVGGETCSIEMVKYWAKNRSYYHVYGPTETTILATIHPCPEQFDIYPIGKPLINTQIYILDHNLHPTPVGVPGEICIGGVGVARGYHDRPGLTAEKFIPDPFGSKPGQRLYRSGDLGRYLADGSIEFIGRIDFQVKVRGFRIELGEIEFRLNQHEDIRSAVVIIREDQPGDKRLTAYMVGEANKQLPVAEIRAWLKETLPDHMVPSSFVYLKEFPLSPNGKVERKALPSPDFANVGDNYRAPRNETEAILVEIWQSVLKVKVGIDDNFFEIGGDSLLSIQIAGAASPYGLSISSRDLFIHPTVAALAQIAGVSREIHAEQHLLHGDLPLTPIQKWFFDQQFENADHWNQCLFLDVQPDLDLARLEKVMAKLLEHHDLLRVRYIEEKGQIRQNIAEQVPEFKIISTDIRQAAPEEIDAILERFCFEVQSSSDIKKGRTVAAGFCLLPNEQARLLIALHHLVVDGVSWRILVEDMLSGYQKLSTGEQWQLPAKTTSYSYWAQKLEQWAQSDIVAKQEEYWSDIKRPQSIPLDFPDTVAKESSVATEMFSVDAKEFTGQTGVSPRDVLLAALSDALCNWAELTKAQWLIDLEGHGREQLFDDIDVNRTIGWFTSLYPLMIGKKATEGPEDLLCHIQETLARVPQYGIGYMALKYGAKGNEHWHNGQILFDYSGRVALDEVGGFVKGVAPESGGPVKGPDNHRAYLLEINAMIVGNDLNIKIHYSKDVHQKNTIKQLCACYRQSLVGIIDWCIAQGDNLKDQLAQKKSFDLHKEARLDPTIVVPQQKAQKIEHILLTGATGFLGAFLLDDLLKHTKATIYCVVRSSDDQKAMKRVLDNLAHYPGENPEADSRVVAIAGDLGQPHLGMSVEKFHELAQKIDIIYHNGASVNLVLGYHAIKGANVTGTEQILRLACIGKTKPVHYVSTLSVFSQGDVDSNDILNESTIPLGDPKLKGGYCQSKWVAERMVMEARKRGLETYIYRTGTISGHSKTGVTNVDDFLCAFIKGGIQLGALPDMGIMLYLTPVNYISEGIVRLSTAEHKKGPVYHLSHPEPVSLVAIARYIQQRGFSLEITSSEIWGDQLYKAVTAGEENALATLIPMLQEDRDKQASDIEFDCSATVEALKELSITCPPLDKNLMRIYFDYFSKSGLL